METKQQRYRMDTLTPGQKFTCASGNMYTYVRRDGALSGVHHVRSASGRDTMFAGCAEVTLGWES